MPAPAMDSGLIRQAVLLASRAPSLHNTQPWRWIADGAALHLHLDRGRIVRNTDGGGREAVIGCGAMLDHLRVAMAAAGWTSDVQRFPDSNDVAHLAMVEFRRSDHVTGAARRTADAILRRRTDRLPLLAPPCWESLVPILRDAVTARVGAEAASIDILADELRPELSRASTLAEETQRFNTGYQAELYWWTAPFDYVEGVPRSALTSTGESDRVGLNRSFPSEGHSARRLGIGDDRASVVILFTPEDTYRDALACGEAMSAVLLECTAAGLATCPVTHVTEVPAARAVVSELIAQPGIPQVLVRVGRAPQIEDVPPMTPRRDLDDILRLAD